jgi:NAD+ kinase
VVLPATDAIELRLTESPAPAALNLDGQVHHELCVGDRIRVHGAGTVSLAYLPERHYFEVLRSKLLWAGHAGE